MNGKDDGLWFAVMANEDDDWSIGTEDIEEAKQMLLEQGQGLIAAINGMICMYKIYYEDIAPKGSYNPEEVEFEIYLLARSIQKLALKLGRDVDLSTLHHSYNDRVSVEVNLFVDRNNKITEDKYDNKVRYEHVKITYTDDLDENIYKGICERIENLEQEIINSK